MNANINMGMDMDINMDETMFTIPEYSNLQHQPSTQQNDTWMCHPMYTGNVLSL